MFGETNRKKSIIKVHILYLGISTNLTTSFKWIICVPNLCYFSTNISRKTCEKKPVFRVKSVFSYKNSPLFWHENFEKGKYKNYVLILENKKWFIFVISTFKSLLIFKFQHHPIFLKSSFWPYLFLFVCQNEYTLMVYDSILCHILLARTVAEISWFSFIPTNTFKFEYLQFLNCRLFNFLVRL